MTSHVTTLTEISQFPTYIYLRFKNYNCITFSSCFIITVPVSKNFIHQPIQKRHNATLSYQNTQVIDIIKLKCIMSLWVLRILIFWDVMLHCQVTIWRNVLPSLAHWQSLTSRVHKPPQPPLCFRWRNLPWIGGLQHINKGLKLVPECITDSGLAFTCPSRDSSPTGATHPSYCGTKEVLIIKEKVESETQLHVIIPEKRGILMRQNESKNSCLLGCDSIIWQTNLDVLKKHSARVLGPEDEGTTIFQRWKQLTQWQSITSQMT